MTTLGNTPTPTILTPEAGGVSIKIEQGVLCENSYERAGSSCNTEKRDIAAVKYESIHPTATENNLKGLGEDSLSCMFSIKHSIFQPDYEIKEEPGVDIDDSYPDEEDDYHTTLNSKSPSDSPNTASKIKVTPTCKLIGSTPRKNSPRPSCNSTIALSTGGFFPSEVRPTTAKLLQQPNGTTDNKRRFACPYENCTKSYGKSSHLRSHLTWHTGIKPFVCKEPNCGKGFTRSDELNRHVRTHTGEKPFECVQCTKKFSRSDHLTKHLATHAKQLAAANGSLTKKTKSEKNLSQATTHLVLESPAASDQAIDIGVVNTSAPRNKSTSAELIIKVGLQKTNVDSLKIKQEEPENGEDNIIASPTLPVQKIEPSVKYEYNVTVKPEPLEEPHVVRGINDVSYEDEPDDDAIMPEANLPPYSQKSKQTIGGVYDPTRPFRCCRCIKTFKRQDDLNRHMRTHTGEKPFACTECDKRFMRTDHLKKHLNTHTRVR